MQNIFIFVLLFLFLQSCGEKETAIVENVDYKLTNHPLASIAKDNLIVSKNATSSSSKIEIVNVFWYGCFSCYHFDTLISEFVKKHSDEVDYYVIPAPLNPTWTLHAKIFFVAKELKIKSAHIKIFKAINKNKISLYSEEQIFNFFKSEFNVVNRKAFDLAFNNKSIDKKIERLRAYLRLANIRGVPAVILDGKFIVLENNKPKHAIEVIGKLLKKLKK